MSQAIIKSIFDPFFTTKFTGRGLGLSAVLGIIRSHEGGIAIDSVEGKGTTFRVVLPVCESPEEMQELPPEETHASSPVRATVLVIDDESEVATMVKDLLEGENYPVITELNPIKGIELYKQHQSEIGVVLLDWTMPEMTGKEVAEALVAMNPNVKIVISTGYPAAEIKTKIDMTKMAGFLQKPYTLKSLLAVVQPLLK
jgi:CheY-like chemotaxis protein